MKIRKCKYNFGNNNDGVFSTINGYATETNNFGETAVGILNKSTLDPDTFTSPDVVTSSKATLFSVGNGSDNVRKNAFEIKANGDTYINGVGGYDGTNSEDATSVGESIQSVQDSSNKVAEDIESIHIERSATGNTYVLKVAGEDRGTITDESGVSFTTGDGLQLVDTDLSVKIDPASESYLTAGQDGLKISGIDAKFGDYLPLSGGTLTGNLTLYENLYANGISMFRDMVTVNGNTGLFGTPGVSLLGSGKIKVGYVDGDNLSINKDGITIPNKTTSDLLNAGGSTTPISDIATQVQASIVDSAPETLDTLNELAAALGDDPNFATTVTNQIAQKADKTTATTSTDGLMSAADKQKLDGLSNYTLPVASATQLGGVRVGDGLEITGEGVLNCTIDPGSGTVSWGNIQGKPTFATVATSGLYSDLTGTPDLSTYVTSTQLTSVAGSNTYTGANYISKETNLTDAVVQLDEEIKATNDNLALEHTNAEATYAKKTELSNYLTRTDASKNYQPKGNYLTTIPSEYVTDSELNAKGYQTEAQVAAKVASLVDSAPETLDTLNELAAALGDDPNFATTITTQLGNKLDTSTYNSDKATFALKSELPDMSNYALKSELPEEYTLPTASTTRLGGVKVGDGLEITQEGVLNCIIDPGSGTVSWGNISGKPTFATVATSGSYNDLTNTPEFKTIGGETILGSGNFDIATESDIAALFN